MKLRNRNVPDYQAITEKNASSLLLQLPPELKLRIYELVCGGQTLHINTKDHGRGARRRRVLSHHLCDEPASEEKVQMAFDSSDAAWNDPATLNRHDGCYMRGMLESSLLQCCRQIYNEANIVRYYSNTFSFHVGEPQCLKLFYRRVPARYRNAIRRLHLSICIRHGALPAEAREWADVFRILSHHTKGIQRLYLTIDLHPYFLDHHLFEYHPPRESHILSCILQEAKMNLKVATVTIDEDMFFAWADPDLNMYEFLWTMAQKQEWAQYLRKALLCHGDLDTSVAGEEA